MMQDPRALWTEMRSEREPFLERARRAASLSKPTLFPDADAASGDTLDNPYQSLGARGLTHLSATIVQTLFPNDLSFARLEPPFQPDDLRDPELRLWAMQSLGAVEQRILLALDEQRWRPALYQASQHYLSAGLAVIDARFEHPRAMRFDRYCVRRDGRGGVLQLVIREPLPYDMLPADVDMERAADMYGDLAAQESTPHLYTVVQALSGGGFSEYQVAAVQDRGEPKMVPGSYREFAAWEDCDFVLLPYEWQEGEHYPRSFFDEIMGDMLGYESLSRANLEGAVIASRQTYFVNPAGMTRVPDVVNANNGSVVMGRGDDVSTLNQRDRMADLSWSQTEKQVLEQRLSERFLLYLPLRRDAERVTAEENRIALLELHKGLGGAYSNLQPMQEHVARIIMRKTVKRDPLFRMVERDFRDMGVDLKLRVLAGVESLGRAEAFQRVTLALGSAAQFFGPDVLNRVVAPERYARWALASMGVPLPPFLRTDEELALLERQQQAMAAQENLGPEIIRQAGEQVRSVNG